MFLRELVISDRTIKSYRIAFSSMTILMLAVVCACSGGVGAGRQSAGSQNQPGEKSGPQAIVDRVPLTIFSVSVFDRDGRFVEGLEHDAFHIYENKSEQKVLYWSREDIPATVALLIDTSNTMRDKIAATSEAAKRFLRASNPKDTFMAASFNDHVERLPTAEDLDALLAKPTVHGRTAMLDALYLGLVELERTRNSKKALLIISDGGDNQSRYSRDDLRKLAKEAWAPIYALMLHEGASGATQEETDDAPDFLAELCKLSGGRMLSARHVKDLPDLGAEIGIELRKQYALGYYPKNEADDKRWRKLEVKVDAKGVRGPLTVYAPPGYYYFAAMR